METSWQEMDKYINKSCKVNDNLIAVNCNDLIIKFGTTRQNVHNKLDRIIKNRDYEKVGEYILINIKK